MTIVMADTSTNGQSTVTGGFHDDDLTPRTGGVEAIELAILFSRYSTFTRQVKLLYKS